MNETINVFIENKHLAIAGVSNRKGNFGLELMSQMQDKGYTIYPVNPKFEKINNDKCYSSVKELPAHVENLLIVVNPDLANKIINDSLDSNIKRVWLHKGVGKGAVSEQNVQLLKDSKLEYVYGFCPMMFIGKGMHKAHYWMRKNLGKTPAEFSKKM